MSAQEGRDADIFTLTVEDMEWDYLLAQAKEDAWWRDAWWVAQWT